MIAVLQVLALLVALTAVVAGLIRLAFVPFSVAFEIRHRGQRVEGALVTADTIFDEHPFVTVVVPAYNEEVVIEHCLRSILRSAYDRYEVIAVDDGSSDDTYARMQGVAADSARITALTQPNAGKGAALNTGIARARGSVIMLVDADGLFGPHTIIRMLRGFTDDGVGAVCGNDRPVNLDRLQTKFLALISHLGTGLMRRAMSELHCVPVVSGNVGAYRREVLDGTGPLREDTVGEDLELTWRVYALGRRITFAPHALLYAESPSTPRALWRQRVRWARGLLQVTRLHWRMVGNPRHGMFGAFLVFNTLTQIVVPFLQVLGLLLLVGFALAGQQTSLPIDAWAVLLFVGLPLSVALLLLSVALDRTPRDLMYVWTLPIWPVYSGVMTLVMIRAVWLELSGAENRWNKLHRTGTVSVEGLVDDGPSPGS
ncbi:MAG: glycosyltransferase family 2 protein [Microlunatus sp.]|nr:glycosyltransferase family 2 protein [Microlunatus sp.]MDN5769940.1 glycosyltransferase family 2 protein [Microlunatus sp.]